MLIMTSAKSVGLVLSGGGARGLAHAGVLKALDELDIRVSIIAGTSAGAMIAVLYAGGVAPEDMPSIIKKNKLFDLKRISFDLKGVIKSDLFREILHEFVPAKTFEDFLFLCWSMPPILLMRNLWFLKRGTLLMQWSPPVPYHSSLPR